MNMESDSAIRAATTRALAEPMGGARARFLGAVLGVDLDAGATVASALSVIVATRAARSRPSLAPRRPPHPADAYVDLVTGTRAVAEAERLMPAEQLRRVARLLG